MSPSSWVRIPCPICGRTLRVNPRRSGALAHRLVILEHFVERHGWRWYTGTLMQGALRGR